LSHPTGTTGDERGYSVLAPYVFIQSLIYLSVERYRTHLADSERGQTAAEYLGIIVVVAAIIAVLATTSIGDTIKTKITDQINKIAK
jgi:pilus assembly protein Flp/PilA